MIPAEIRPAFHSQKKNAEPSKKKGTRPRGKLQKVMASEARGTRVSLSHLYTDRGRGPVGGRHKTSQSMWGFCGLAPLAQCRHAVLLGTPSVLLRGQHDEKERGAEEGAVKNGKDRGPGYEGGQAHA